MIQISKLLDFEILAFSMPWIVAIGLANIGAPGSLSAGAVLAWFGAGAIRFRKNWPILGMSAMSTISVLSGLLVPDGVLRDWLVIIPACGAIVLLLYVTRRRVDEALRNPQK